jgi:hypothetical protein
LLGNSKTFGSSVLGLRKGVVILKLELSLRLLRAGKGRVELGCLVFYERRDFCDGPEFGQPLVDLVKG